MPRATPARLASKTLDRIPNAAMSGPIVYVDTSEIRDGALAELRRAIGELAAFVDANEPRLLAYNAYFSDDGRRMTVVHIHEDSASLEDHMDRAGPAFAEFAGLLTLSSIRIYGEPNEKAVRKLHEKARLLGCSDVAVHHWQTGFSRFRADEP